MADQSEERKRYDEMAAMDGDAAVSHYAKTGPRFRLQRVVREAVRLSPGRILDLGCGDGVVMEHVRRALPETEIVGLDWSRVSLGRAHKRGFTAIQADAGCLPLKQEKFDLVIATEVLEHVADPDALLCEAHRALRPGGHLLITVPAADWFKSLVGLFDPGRVKLLDAMHRREWAVRGFGKFAPVAELRDMIRNSGFAVDRCRGVYYWVWRWERMLDQRLAAGSKCDAVLRAVDRLIGALPGLAVVGKYLMIAARKRERG
ncbi:MAG: methyltransferase domain-containing protein [Candidatus Edwardsbacteria bacterium]|nr:methyltransferase domain-containing protein [Candidatus Edwardsbacteria bacterium]